MIDFENIDCFEKMKSIGNIQTDSMFSLDIFYLINYNKIIISNLGGRKDGRKCFVRSYYVGCFNCNWNMSLEDMWRKI